MFEQLLSISGFEHPWLLISILPAAIILFIIVRWNSVRIRKETYEDYNFVKARKKQRLILFITRLLIFSLILIALAGPYGETLTTIQSDPKIHLLIDNSSSMAALDTSFIPRMKESLEEYLPVTVSTLASGSESSIGDGLLFNIERDKNVLLITDGKNNEGTDLTDVALLAASLNASISAIELEPSTRDVAVSIYGPNKVVADVDSTFTIRASMLGIDRYKITVTVDGGKVIDITSSEPMLEFTESFREGTHEIVATVSTDGDYFSQNNVFYKTVRVVQKPEVLYVSKTSGPMRVLLTELYDVTDATTLPSDYEDYYAVVVDDVPISNLKNTDKLTDFVLQGNGLVVVGGYNSFDYGDYKKSVFETILPVYVSGAKKAPGGDRASIVILLDISKSTATSFSGTNYSVSDIEKALALDVINQLSESHTLGIVAFHEDVFLVRDLEPLAGEKDAVIDKVSRLVEGGTSTVFSHALEAAYKLLKDAKGSKNVILISDGRAKDSISQNLDYSKTMAKNGIKIYTIGTDVRDIYTKYFMQDLAENTNGIFFEPSQANRIKILFGDPEDEEDDDGVYKAEILNNYHFITEGLTLDATMYGYNQVVPKSNAKMLVALDNGAPLLTVMRYGLGRVAAITSFSGPQNLGELLNARNSRMVSRTINWAIGDPERNEPYFVLIDDTRLGSTSEVVLKTESTPKIEGMDFEKIGEDTFSYEFIPEKQGFNEILSTKYAVNYPREYQSLGFDHSMQGFADMTGGKIFKADDLEEMVEYAKAFSKKTIIKRQTILWPFLGLALLIFLAEITYRRIMELRS